MNLKHNFKDISEDVLKLFYRAAKCFRKNDFHKYFGNLIFIDEKVVEYLKEVGYHKWEKSHFRGTHTFTIYSILIILLCMFSYNCYFVLFKG